MDYHRDWYDKLGQVTLWSTAAKEQERRLVEDPWEETIRTFLKKHSSGEERVDVITGKELLERAIDKHTAQQQPADLRKLRGIMRRIGWKYGVHRRSGGWLPGGRVKGYRRPVVTAVT